MKHVDVAYALIPNTAGQVLMVKNRKGTWSLPGGARERLETITTTVERECLEEASAKVSIGKLAAVSEATKGDEAIVFFVFHAKLIEIKPRQPDAEIEEVAWMAVAEATQLMPWYPGGVEALIAAEGAIYF